VSEKTKRCTRCPHCSAFNGLVKKTGPIKFYHERYKVAKNNEEALVFKNTFAVAYEALRVRFACPLLFQSCFLILFRQGLDTLIEQGRAQEDLNPLVVLQLFRNIPDADCRVLDMDPLKGRPESLLLETLIVPPVCIRPSAPSKNEGKDDSTEDDLTAMLRGACSTRVLLIYSFLCRHRTDIMSVNLELQKCLRVCLLGPVCDVSPKKTDPFDRMPTKLKTRWRCGRICNYSARSTSTARCLDSRHPARFVSHIVVFIFYPLSLTPFPSRYSKASRLLATANASRARLGASVAIFRVRFADGVSLKNPFVCHFKLKPLVHLLITLHYTGKRVDFSGRTVISPDPNLRIDQVALPIDVCKILTFPERVTEHNIEWLRTLVKNGPDGQWFFTPYLAI
jgi:hypothetical protein